VTQVFGTFKSGDLGRISKLAAALARQIKRHWQGVQKEVGAVVGVPLCEYKKDAGETDRVKELGRRVAEYLDIPYSHSLELSGKISRRLYKSLGNTEEDFRRDYRNNLRVQHTPALRSALADGKDVLLIDDVFTDGVTTEVVADVFANRFSIDSDRIRVATLGLMAKQNNMDDDLINSWR
jgi:predicted amidophosphoribosyltransferase